MNELRFIGVRDLPEIKYGDNIADLLAERVTLNDGDVIVVAAKIVSKAEGQVVAVAGDPTARAALISQNSKRTLRRNPAFSITETPHGFVCANAGIGWSNVEPGHAALLPRDPDRSAYKFRERLRATRQVDVAVVISDTFDRAWRLGVTDVAIGSSGIIPMLDLRGAEHDSANSLTGPAVCTVDQLAGAAGLIMGKARQVPVVVVRGVDLNWLDAGADDVQTAVLRKGADDLFR